MGVVLISVGLFQGNEAFEQPQEQEKALLFEEAPVSAPAPVQKSVNTDEIRDVVEPETIESTTTIAQETTPNPAVTEAADPVKEYISGKWWPVTKESRDDLVADPPIGAALWWPLGGNFPFVGPGEKGLSKITSHLNPGNPHENTVDDSPNDEKGGGESDTGLKIGDKVWFALEDLQECEYVVTEPLDTGMDDELGIFRVPVPGSDTEFQPAVYYLKDWSPDRLETLVNWVDQVGDRSVVMLIASYGGPNGTEISGGHRIYNSVVFAELVQCTPGEALEQ